MPGKRALDGGLVGVAAERARGVDPGLAVAAPAVGAHAATAAHAMMKPPASRRAAAEFRTRTSLPPKRRSLHLPEVRDGTPDDRYVNGFGRFLHAMCG